MSGAAYLGKKNTNMELSIAGNTTACLLMRLDAAEVLATKARLKYTWKLKETAPR